MNRPFHSPCTPPRQGGAMSIMLAMMLMVLLTFIGTAFDLGQVYNRRTDLQNLADSAVLAAAKKLDGTGAGIANAAAAASAVAATMKYQYGQSIVWDNAAISFSTAPVTPDAGWLDVAAAGTGGAAANLMYVKVDTGALSAALGLVALPFFSALNVKLNGVTLDSLSIHSSAVAGRITIPVTPLGVCALSPTPVAQRISGALVEAVQFGYRRGINYNLLNLSPVGATPLNFLIDPINDPATANFALADVAPFVCSGTMPMTSLPATVRVQYPFPAALAAQLNSRFDVYTAASSLCDPVGAPPDTNVKEYLSTTVTAPTEQTAVSNPSPGPLVTVADPDPPPAGITAPNYGVLWSYAMAAKWVAGNPASYPNLAKTNWATLYPAPPGAGPAPGTYPAANTPYGAGAGVSYFLGPSHPGVAKRRVLNLPLLSCPDPVGGNYSTATVLAIGQFFMSAKASATRISGEFAGILTPVAALGTTVRLYR